MRRRKFITLLASAAAWPLSSRAQQPERMRRMGVFRSPAEGDIERERLLTDFRDALQNLGWREGHNVSFIYRWAAGRNDLIEAYAKELVALAPDLILTQSAQLVAAVRHQTRTLPILFGAASDPV